jgi:hypothetical protein
MAALPAGAPSSVADRHSALVQSALCGRDTTLGKNIESLHNDASSRLDVAAALRCHPVRRIHRE